MEYQLYNQPNKDWSTLKQYLYNRGMSEKEINEYLNYDIDNVEPPENLGEEQLKEAFKIVCEAVLAQEKIFCIVDCDLDGYCSAAIFINYLHDLFPAYVENNGVDYRHHDGKSHGLKDCIEEAKKFKYVVCIDSTSNDVFEQEILSKQGSKVVIIDHHIIEKEPYPIDNVVLINNQNYSQYENKELCGGGLIWQVCRYWDKLSHNNYADSYIDLAAIANVGDMMDMRSKETKAIIFEGLKASNIKNPFIYYLAEKNEFSLNKSDYAPSENNRLSMSPIGAAFFIVPMVNAITRSGEIDEKYLMFESMLNHKAFTNILSNKRGHKVGEEEKLVVQVMRLVTNVKNRQERNVTAGMEMLENKIKQEHMMENHKVLMFTFEKGQIPPSIAGLVANKIMSKYQRCVLALTKGIDSEGREIYAGSARGYSGSGLDSFKKVCAASSASGFQAGHDNAFGASVYVGQEDKFYKDTDEILADFPDWPCYKVDYIWNEENIEGSRVIELAECNDYIGTGIPRASVVVEDVFINNSNLSVMKGNTVKIKTKSGIDIMKFGMTEEEIDSLIGKTITIVGKPNKNEWMGNITPQILIEEYQFSNHQPSAIQSWGF